MPDEMLQPCAYHVVRYQPNLIRDEWVNIGVLLFIPEKGPENGPEKNTGDAPLAGRVRQRWLEEPADLVRLRRLHPAADEELLLRLPAEFDRQFAGREMEAGAILEKFDETLSNAVQLAPRKGLLSRDPDAELDRIFREQVEPLREARRGAGGNPHAQRRARPGRGLFPDRKNPAPHAARRARRGVHRPGRSHAHRLFLPPQRDARLRACGGARPRSRTGQAPRLHRRGDPRARKASEFLAVTEREPARGNVRDQFVSEIFKEAAFEWCRSADLRKWAHDVAPVLRAELP